MGACGGVRFGLAFRAAVHRRRRDATDTHPVDLARRTIAFSFRRQRLDGSATSALDAVAAVVGVYSTNPTGPLSIHARAPSATRDEVLALDADRATVRMRAMRTSGFAVPRSTAPLVRAATSVPMERFSWMLRGAHVPDDALAATRRAVLAAADRPSTAQELRARVDIAGLEMAPFVSWLSLRGDLVAIGSGSLTSNASRYLSREAWLAGDEEPDDPDPAAARTWLAGEYLHAFGPARVADLAWWAAMSARVAADAIAAHETVDVGDGLLLLAEDVDAFEAGEPLDGALTLVPKWDAWTMGYPIDGRSRFLDHEVHDRVFDGDGNGLGMVLVDGRAIGAWIHRAKGTAMEVDLDLFGRAGAKLRERIDAAFGDAAAFLGYRRAEIRSVDSVIPNRRRLRRPLA